MKTYKSEKEFTEMFAKDVNNGEKEYEVNGIEFQVSGKSVNSSKAAVYAVTINGQDKAVTIMQLKKMLNVTYKKEYNRTGESAKKANTTVTIKTDEELKKTAESAVGRIFGALATAVKTCNAYSLNFEEYYNLYCMDNRDRAAEIITDKLKADRDNAIATQKAAEEKAAKEKAAKVETVTELTAELQKALAEGNLTKVAEISAKLAKAAK